MVRLLVCWWGLPKRGEPCPVGSPVGSLFMYMMESTRQTFTYIECCRVPHACRRSVWLCVLAELGLFSTNSCVLVRSHRGVAVEHPENPTKRTRRQNMRVSVRTQRANCGTEADASKISLSFSPFSLFSNEWWQVTGHPFSKFHPRVSSPIAPHASAQEASYQVAMKQITEALGTVLQYQRTTPTLLSLLLVVGNIGAYGCSTTRAPTDLHSAFLFLHDDNSDPTPEARWAAPYLKT